jgi:hypothetical protein
VVNHHGYCIIDTWVFHLFYFYRSGSYDKQKTGIMVRTFPAVVIAMIKVTNKFSDLLRVEEKNV